MSTTETPQEAAPGSPAVGANIRAIREEAHLTQQDLADAVGVTQTAVSYWEAAKRDPGTADLLRIAEALHVPASSLLGAPEPEPEPAGTLPPPVADFGPVRLELMGHRYREGHLSEVVIAGQPFLRLDLKGGVGIEFYAPSSVYCISPGMTPPPVPRGEIPARFGWAASDDDDDDAGPF